MIKKGVGIGSDFPLNLKVFSLYTKMVTEVRDDLAIFVLMRPDGTLGGFLEVALRGYAEGCATTPVGYLEGLYLDPELRGRGLSRQLVAAAEAWARDQGCQEMASDCLLDNTHSLAVHLALGYSEVERIICFRKPLDGEDRANV